MIDESIIPYVADLCNDSQRSFLYLPDKKVKEKWGEQYQLSSVCITVI